MTTNDINDLAVALPATSILAVGSGAQGVHVLRFWGAVEMKDFDAGFTEMLQVLDEEEASAEAAAALRLIAEVAARATSWCHLVVDGQDLPPCVVLLAPDEVLVASMQGPMIEWVVGGRELLGRVMERVASEAVHATLLLTRFVGQSPVAGVRLAGGTADVMAADPREVADLTAAAEDGIVGLGRVLAAQASGVAS